MSTAIKTALSLLAISLLAGCAPSLPSGLLYSDTTSPYSRKFDETPVGSKRCVIHDHQIREPVSGYNLYAEWTSAYILSEARKAGISNIHYMDKRTFSILLGIYRRESLIIYGD